MFLTSYSPYRNLSAVDRLFDSIFHGNSDSNSADQLQKYTATPVADVWEEKGSFLVELELPGVRKEDIDINVEDGVLSVQAKRKSARAEVEYVRRFRVADNLDSESINAKYEDGVLRLELKRKQSAVAKKINVG